MQIGGGKYKSRKLFEPSGLKTRPTSIKLRLAIFNKLQDSVINSNFLDLFAGVGAMGLEAISRGAKQSTFVEKEKVPFQLIKKNAESLDCAAQCRFVQGEAIRFCEREKGPYDIIFADPPYNLKRGDKYLSTILIEIIVKGGLLKKGGDFFLEEGSDEIPFENITLVSLKNYGSSTLYHFTL